MIKKLTGKILATGIAAITIAATLLSSVSAADKRYALKDVNLYVTVPDDYAVITRETTTSDSNYNYIDMDPMKMTADMEQRHLYLYAIPKDEDAKYDLSITALATNEESYTELSSDELDKVIAQSRKDLEATAFITVNSIKVHDQKQVPVLMYDVVNSSDSSGLEQVYMLEGAVVYNGIHYSIRLQSYGKEFDDSQKMMFTNLIDNLEFKEIKGTSTGARIFGEAIEMLIGTAITIVILGVILFVLTISKKNKKKHVI